MDEYMVEKRMEMGLLDAESVSVVASIFCLAEALERVDRGNWPGMESEG
jgi:hypothetical protein